MNMQLELALSTLIVPFALSFILKKLLVKHKQFEVLAVFATWLVSYVWIAGLPSFLPKEAIEWCVYLGVAAILISFFMKINSRHKSTSNLNGPVSFFALSIIGIILVTWPVLSRSPDLQLLTELFFFGLIAVVITYRSSYSKPVNPALTLGISNAGLAIVAGLGGSLLIGQLAGALAASLGAYALLELFKKLKTAELRVDTSLLVSLLSLIMLVVARVFAEIPFTSAIFIGLALMLGLSVKGVFGSSLSMASVVASIVWLLSTSDQSSYY